MKECPFCLRPIATDDVNCPNCGNSVDIFRTGYFARPNLSRPKTAFIWIAAIVLLVLVGVGIFRGCAARQEVIPPSASR